MAEHTFRSFLDRDHDVLLVYGDPRPIAFDLEIHLASVGISHDTFTLKLLEDGLAALALWTIARPRFEAHGWTIALHEPRANLFFTGSTREKTVIGRAFHEHLAAADRSLFYAQTKWGGGELRTSSVEVEGTDIFSMVEQFALKSEQIRARLFRGGDGRIALLWPFPGSDAEWIAGLRADEALARETSEGLKFLAGNEVNFRCGCDLDRITRIVFELYKGQADEFFGGEPTVEAECPRCGARHEIVRESFERLRS
jgi:hypothetical protein